MEYLDTFIHVSTDLFVSTGPLLGFFLVFIECFIPMLPLNLFVALNVNAYGMFLGVLISWMATCLGSFFIYLIFYYFDQKITKKFLNRKLIQKVSKVIDSFQKISFSELVLLITMPFTPAFFINVLCGLAGISKEKYVSALLIGKVFSILFWAYVGKSFLDSIRDIYSIIFILVALGVAYIISKIISRKWSIE